LVTAAGIAALDESEVRTIYQVHYIEESGFAGKPPPAQPNCHSGKFSNQRPPISATGSHSPTRVSANNGIHGIAGGEIH